MDAPSLSVLVTFLFSDIEGSTQLWEREPERMRTALARHDGVAREAVESNHGSVVKMTGDGIHAAFADPVDAVVAALQLQQALVSYEVPDDVTLRVRCGVHSGMVENRDNDFFGTAVNRAARIMAAAHGGQVIVSQAVADHVAKRLPPAVSLRDLGSVRLRDLARPERVFQVVQPGLRHEFPALRSLETTPNNLAQQVNTFVGRERELAEVKKLLASVRLVTLLGAGGLGKTRLSLHVAVDLLDHFPDGVWLVELAPLADDRLLPQAVASVLSVREEAGRPLRETLANFVRDRKLMLILDNCEHLLPGCAELANLLLQAGAGVSVLTSSREPLHVPGESTYPVPSLELPDPQQTYTADSVGQLDAVRLFVDRAVAAQPDFKVTSRNAMALAAICRRLDGLPLAIELAAARVRALSVETILERLSDGFRLLSTGDRTALPRQQTLRACIDWSYDLLTDSERALLSRLAVFAGGWTLEAAESVGSAGDAEPTAVLDLMTQLVDKSLVAMEAEGTRYRMLETVRQYAGEKLDARADADAVRGRHRDYFLTLVEEAEPNLLGPEQPAWLKRLEEEHDNVRASLKYSVAEPGSSAGLRFCASLQRFWITRGHLAEGREWYVQVLAKGATEAPTTARARALNGAGLLAYHQLDYTGARARHEECLATFRELDDRKGMAASLNNLGMLALDQGDFARARSLHEESLALSRTLDNRNAIARSLGNLGMVAAQQREFESARALFEECLVRMRELGDREGIAISVHALAEVASEQCDYVAARALCVEGLTILRELDHRGRIGYTLEVLAIAIAALGDSKRAARIWGAAERVREELGSLPADGRPRDHPRVVAARKTSGDDAGFDRAWEDGRTMTFETAIGFALE